MRARTIRVFQPPPQLPADCIPLYRRVEALCREGRLRSALNIVLDGLSEKPDDPGLLFVAAAVFLHHSSRTNRLNFAEPLTEEVIRDPRLDPLMTLCSSCQSSTWVSRDILMPRTTKLTVLNPVGLQCQVCGYVCCRDCLSAVPMSSENPEASTISKHCPGCGSEALGRPVMPTGRPQMQMDRFFPTGHGGVRAAGGPGTADWPRAHRHRQAREPRCARRPGQAHRVGCQSMARGSSRVGHHVRGEGCARAGASG